MTLRIPNYYLGADAAPQIAELLADKPDFELYQYDGYGHVAYDLAPDYKDRLLRFFRTARGQVVCRFD